MTTKPPKTPQQKKSHSLKRDCRNVYGENDKAARKAIPLRKAKEIRSTRRKSNQAIAQVERLDEAQADVVESSVRQDVHRLGSWTKLPDAPLEKTIAWTKEARVWRVTRRQRGPES